MVVLYSNHCPRCNILKSKLTSKGILFSEVDDEETLSTLGFDFMPILEVDGKMMEFGDANKYIESMN